MRTLPLLMLERTIRLSLCARYIYATWSSSRDYTLWLVSIGIYLNDPYSAHGGIGPHLLEIYV